MVVGDSIIRVSQIRMARTTTIGTILKALEKVPQHQTTLAAAIHMRVICRVKDGKFRL